MDSRSVRSFAMDNSVLQRTRFWLLVLLVISVTVELPVVFIVVPAVSIAMVIVADRFNFRIATARVSGLGYVLTLIFLIHAIWFLPHIVKTGSTKLLERALPYLLFPIMISSTPLKDHELRKLLKIFIWSVVVSYLLSTLAAVYHYFYSVPYWGRATDFFFHEQFTQGLFNIHPTYYSLLGCLATLFAFRLLTSGWRILTIGFLTIVILAINARITFVIQLVLILAFVVNGFSRGFSVRRLVVLVGSGVVLFFAIRTIGSIYDYPHRKIVTDLESAWTRSFASDISDGDGGVVMRMAIWRSAWKVFEEHPVLGVGLGYEEQYLVAEYTGKGYSYLAGGAFNAHNQLLSYLIVFGLTGVVLLGIVYFVLMREAYRRKFRLYFVFVAMFVCVAVTESIFNRLLGISMFAFFNALLLLKLVNHDK